MAIGHAYDAATFITTGAGAAAVSAVLHARRRIHLLPGEKLIGSALIATPWYEYWMSKHS